MDKLFEFELFKIYDFHGAESPGWIYRDVVTKDLYGLNSGTMSFQDDDIIIDIGANVGIFSVHLALMHPNVKILAYEPSAENFRHLMMNLECNNIKNVIAHNLALTCDGREIEIGIGEGNTGGACMYDLTSGNHRNKCQSITLDSIVNNYPKIKLVKCDVEQAEYEIFENFKGWEKVEFLAGETHPPPYCTSLNRDGLIQLLKSKIQPNKLFLMEA